MINTASEATEYEHYSVVDVNSEAVSSTYDSVMTQPTTTTHNAIDIN